jgi:hypothetical protein
MNFGLIVEGHGEVQAVPLLVRRIAEWIGFEEKLTIHQPIRVHRDRVVKQGELERHLELVARRVGPGGAILILVDADNACAASLGPELLARARKARSDRRIAVVLAVREYEAWLIASAKSLRGERTLPPDLEAPDDPEALPHAKAWLGARMQHGYSETLEQPKLTAKIDLAEARRAGSFDKLVREVCALLERRAPERGGIA